MSSAPETHPTTYEFVLHVLLDPRLLYSEKDHYVTTFPRFGIHWLTFIAVSNLVCLFSTMFPIIFDQIRENCRYGGDCIWGYTVIYIGAVIFHSIGVILLYLTFRWPSSRWLVHSYRFTIFMDVFSFLTLLVAITSTIEVFDMERLCSGDSCSNPTILLGNLTTELSKNTTRTNDTKCKVTPTECRSLPHQMYSARASQFTSLVQIVTSILSIRFYRHAMRRQKKFRPSPPAAIETTQTENNYMTRRQDGGGQTRDSSQQTDFMLQPSAPQAQSDDSTSSEEAIGDYDERLRQLEEDDGPRRRPRNIPAPNEHDFFNEPMQPPEYGTIARPPSPPPTYEEAIAAVGPKDSVV